MRIYFDTEFYEDGKTIDLMSIGMVREDGLSLYYLNQECDWSKPYSNGWHCRNTLPHLWDTPTHGNGLPDDCYAPRGRSVEPRIYIAQELLHFCREPHQQTGDRSAPEFWAWYADYDWVALCQLFGTMNGLPEDWPQYCRDLKQTVDENDWFQKSKEDDNHNALGDALWLKKEHERFLWEVRNDKDPER